MTTNDYLKLVGTNVAAQGKPSGDDYIKAMGERVQAEIRKSVPARNRLAVRMAIRKYTKQLTKAAAKV